jgi:hypothetical protein
LRVATRRQQCSQPISAAPRFIALVLVALVVFVVLMALLAYAIYGSSLEAIDKSKVFSLVAPTAR